MKKESAVSVTALRTNTERTGKQGRGPHSHRMAWHYTVGGRIDAILGSGFLLPATAGVEAPERPAVWFSLDQHWERTATKAIRLDDGSIRVATIEEMWSKGDGLFRFGADPRALLTGESLRRAARINRATWSRLVQSARDLGADPSDWFGCVGALAVGGLELQAMTTPGGEWLAVPAMQRASEGVPA